MSDDAYVPPSPCGNCPVWAECVRKAYKDNTVHRVCPNCATEVKRDKKECAAAGHPERKKGVSKTGKPYHFCVDCGDSLDDSGKTMPFKKKWQPPAKRSLSEATSSTASTAMPVDDNEAMKKIDAMHIEILRLREQVSSLQATGARQTDFLTEILEIIKS